MERIKKEVVVPKSEPVVPKLRWRKLGGGSLRWNNMIIKPGQVFEADVEELPKAFLTSLEAVEPEKLKAIVEKKTVEERAPEELFFLKETKKGWNVVNEFGKPINEKPLTKDQAQELKQALDSE